MLRRPRRSTLFPSTTLFRPLQSLFIAVAGTWGPVLFMACLIAVGLWLVVRDLHRHAGALRPTVFLRMLGEATLLDRKSTRLNSSHVRISYAGLCLGDKIRSR